MHPFVALMRRYVVDYLLCQNPDVCAQIMEPDYVLHMGGTELGPRDEVYVPAVVKQLVASEELQAYQHHGFWQPMDTLRDKQHLEDLWQKKSAPWKVW